VRGQLLGSVRERVESTPPCALGLRAATPPPEAEKAPEGRAEPSGPSMVSSQSRALTTSKLEASLKSDHSSSASDFTRAIEVQLVGIEVQPGGLVVSRYRR
jgi:hypothetical protein